MNNNYQWVKVAESMAEVTQRGSRAIAEINTRGKTICLVNSGNQLYACAAKCPHAGGRLADGATDSSGNIICPLHRYRFRLSNGYNSSGEGFHLRTYPVIENEEGVFVGFPASPGFL